MANIPHSSRYRTSGNKASANAGAAGRTGSAHNGSTAQAWIPDQPSSSNWLWALVLFGVVLYNFPAQVLSVIGLGLLAYWFLGKK